MQVLELLKRITNENNIFVNEPMSKHTTFKTGGSADFFVLPESKEELKNILSLDLPKTILGNGSNILVKDGGIRGIVICLTKLNSFSVKDEYIEADAGIMLAKLSQIACDNKLTGLEFACGIPGTLGGAVMMNAGAYGSDMSNIIELTYAVDDKGNMLEIKEHNFGYRKSIFKNSNYIIISSRLKLSNGNKKEIESKMEEYKNLRFLKQPINFPSAGSTFKRPEGYFAGKLIEDANLKGYSIGGAQVSEKHAGFVINKGGASSRDILELIKYIQKEVYDKFNVFLETEIEIIGEDDV